MSLFFQLVLSVFLLGFLSPSLTRSLLFFQFRFQPFPASLEGHLHTLPLNILPPSVVLALTVLSTILSPSLSLPPRLPPASLLPLLLSSSLSSQSMPPPPPPSSLMFGRFAIPAEHIFYTSSSGLSVAFVNLKPIVPGHVLVIPSRSNCGARMSDLTASEHEDLWRTVREIQPRIEGAVNAAASNVAVQDGGGAGQSVPHVHVHVLPRVDGDLPEDAVYGEIEKWHPWSGERVAAGARVEVPEVRVDRTGEAMAAEAAGYRALF